MLKISIGRTSQENKYACLGIKLTEIQSYVDPRRWRSEFQALEGCHICLVKDLSLRESDLYKLYVLLP